MAIVEKVEIPLESLEKIALENAKNAAPNTHVVKREYRYVNGLKVLMLQMNGTMQGISFSYFGYYYSDSNGTVQLVGYTSQNLLSLYKSAIEDFLNGLTRVR